MAQQSVKGMKDLLPENQKQHRFILDSCLEIARRFDFKEISSPILEPSSVFEKTLGGGTAKECYQFLDKGGDQLTLRPEGTAGIVRALIQHKLYQGAPLRFFYSGPMFRRERPQKGRFRQFHQAGFEVFGQKDPSAEGELIEMAQMVLKELHILDKTSLLINSIGDTQSQTQYQKKLLDYFTPYEKELSEDSRRRLKENPLRILDSKSPQDKKFLNKAPRPMDSLSKDSKTFFEELKNILSKSSIPFTQDDFLVRGLDYYRHSVFEYVLKEDPEGSQSAVLAGGRYDNLVHSMGGADVPAVGWALGVERTAMLLEPGVFKKTSPLLAVLASNPELKSEEAKHISLLRQAGFYVFIPDFGTLSKQMKRASKRGCDFVFILEDEKLKTAVVKNMKTGEQKQIPLEHIKDSGQWPL